jgi:hypothetical protein
MSRAETRGIAHVVWFVSAIYFVAGPTLAYVTALAGFGLVAAGFRYAPFRMWLLELVRGRSRR